MENYKECINNQLKQQNENQTNIQNENVQLKQENEILKQENNEKIRLISEKNSEIENNKEFLNNDFKNIMKICNRQHSNIIKLNEHINSLEKENKNLFSLYTESKYDIQTQNQLFNASTQVLYLNVNILIILIEILIEYYNPCKEDNKLILEAYFSQFIKFSKLAIDQHVRNSKILNENENSKFKDCLQFFKFCFTERFINSKNLNHLTLQNKLIILNNTFIFQTINEEAKNQFIDLAVHLLYEDDSNTKVYNIQIDRVQRTLDEILIKLD